MKYKVGDVIKHTYTTTDTHIIMHIDEGNVDRDPMAYFFYEDGGYGYAMLDLNDKSITIELIC